MTLEQNRNGSSRTRVADGVRREARLCCMAVFGWMLCTGGAPAATLSGGGGPVKIGLVLRAQGPLAGVGTSMRRAVALAIAQANAGHGFRGRPFVLCVAETDGPWGSGAKRIVDLVFRDRVQAVLGGVDGREAHLIEQIITKARVPYLSTWATDPTLAQINIPWFFSCMPGDRQQAGGLIQRLLRNSRGHTLATLYADTYDARSAEKTFVKIARGKGFTIRSRRKWQIAGQDSLRPGKWNVEGGLDGVVLFAQAGEVKKAQQWLQSRAPSVAVFAPLRSSPAALPPEPAASDPPHRIISQTLPDTPAYQAFRHAYRARYGVEPDLAAAFAYDGARLLITAIRRAGTGREAIRAALAASQCHDGVTGSMRFNSHGVRESVPTAGSTAAR